MENKRAVNLTSHIFTGLFFTGIFIFFSFFYYNHLRFEEQVQLFLLTGDFFLSKIGCPGGFAGYIGSFLTQFYFLSFAGSLIIIIVLFAIQQVIQRILYRINPEKVLFPVSFLPSLLAAIILCNEFYPLSAIIGFLLAMLAALLYINIKTDRRRFFSGLIIIPVTYWLAGGSFISLLPVMLMYEFLMWRKGRKKNINREDGKQEAIPPYSLKVWHFTAYMLIAAAVPLIVRRYLIMQPLFMTFMSEYYYNIRTSVPTAVLVLFVVPVLLMALVSFIRLKEKQLKAALGMQIIFFLILGFFGFRSFANLEAEEIMKYDYLVRNERWGDALEYAGEKPPRNYLSLAMLNLALAKTGQLGDRMFEFDQHGVNGLFLPFNKEYVAPMMGNEIFYHLGLTNASQEYAFESMETIPDMGKSARILKRLAETNLINGQYEVSEKYLKILEKTLFYKKWAKTTRSYLYDEDKINNNSEWGEKRKFMVRNDYFFHVKNMEASLNRMVKENPGNKTAFEYLMAFYLINKDLRNFLNMVPVMEQMNYRSVPASYQEALLYIISLNNKNPMGSSPAYISESTKSRMKAYADIYTKYPDAKERLKKNYSDTYWYYLHYKGPENTQEQK